MSGNGGGDYYAPAIDELEGLEARAVGWERPIPFDEIELPPFPTDILPLWLQLFVEAEAKATQTPTDLAGMLSLAACAAAAQGKVRIRIVPGWEEPTNLYIVVVLDPASRKSAVYSHVMAPLEEWEADEAKRMAPEIAKAQAERRVIEQALKNAEKRAAKAGGATRGDANLEVADLATQLEEKAIPATPQLILDDVTPEKLVMALAEQGGRVAVMSAEGGGPFGLMRGRYAKNGLPNFEAYLKAHGGDTLKVHRVGRAPDHVEKPALTLGLTIQPDVLRSLTDEPEFRGRGLLGRFLYSVPENLVGHRARRAPPMPAEIVESYRAHMRALLDMPQQDQALDIDDDARELLFDFKAEIEPRLGPDGDLYTIRDWAGKVVGAAARMAAVIHSVHSVHCVPKGLKPHFDSIGVGIKLARYLLPHAMATYAAMGRDGTVGLAKYTLRKLRDSNRPEVSKRDAHRLCRGRIPLVTDLDPVLEKLVEYGYLRLKIDQPRTGSGRRPSPVFEIYPLRDNMDTMDTSPKETSGTLDTMDTMDTIAEDDCPV